MDGAVAASAVSNARISTPAARVHVPANPAPIAQLVNPANLTTMMPAAIDAAVMPMKEKMEATIIPMQRTIDSWRRSLSQCGRNLQQETTHARCHGVRDCSCKARQRH